MTNVHIVPNGTEWKVEGKTVPSAMAKSKRDALRKGREIAGKRNLHLVIHRKDGSIQKVIRPKFANHAPNQHVVPHEGKWAVRPEHGKKVSSTFFWKPLAVMRAKEIAENYHSTLVIHGSDGRIDHAYKPGFGVN